MEKKDNKFIYFPSFSVGNFESSLKKDFKFKDGTPINFYSKDYPEKYRHPYFLVTAGHFYKKMDFRAEHPGMEDALLLGDSGGFQVASGALKWSDDLREKIFLWLERNSDVAMNLDIPPKMDYAGKFEHCLDLSKKNFKYFADNQTGATKFLNVIQGTNEHEYKHWYQQTKDYPFNGWSIGGAGKSIYAFMSALCALVEGGEHLKAQNEFLHVLGATKITDFYVVSQIQRSFNEVNSNMVVTTDSSTPSIAVVYGYYYTEYSLRDGTFKFTHLPKRDPKFQSGFRIPEYTEWDKEHIKKIISPDDVMDWNNEAAVAFIMHNFYFFKDAMDTIDDFVNNHNYILAQNCPGGEKGDWIKILRSIDEMIKSDDPRLVFDRHKSLYMKISNTESKAKSTFGKFFK